MHHAPPNAGQTASRLQVIAAFTAISIACVAVVVGLDAGGILRQSTGCKDIIGPFVITADGAGTYATAIPSTLVWISKNGAAPVTKSQAGDSSHVGQGFHAMSFNSTDTDTLGRLTVWIQLRGKFQVWKEYAITNGDAWDALFSTGKLPVNTVLLLGTQPATSASGVQAVKALTSAGADVVSIQGTAPSTAESGVLIVKAATSLQADVRKVLGTQPSTSESGVLIVKAATSLQADVRKIQGTAPTTASAGTLVVKATTAHVTSVANNAITAASVADSAIDAATFAAGAISAGAIAADAITADKIAANAIGANELADDAIDAGAIATGAIDADAIADNAIDAGAIATDAIGATEMAAGAFEADVFANNAITAAAIATDAIGADEAGFLTDSTGFNGGAIAAILTDTGTDGVLLAATATSATLVDAVWDEAIAGHLGAGSVGAALNAAGGAGDPWSTAIPGAYGAGTAGKLLGDALAAISAVNLALYEDLIDGTGGVTLTGAITGNITGNLIGTVSTVTTLTNWHASVTDWTDGGRLDLLLDAIGTDVAGLDGAAMRGTDNAALATTALTNATWTDARAGYLDVAISSRLAPTTAGRTLDITGGGCAGLDWANVESPTSTVALTNTTVGTTTTVTNDASGVLLLSTTVATVTSQTALILTAGADYADAYNGCTVVIYDASNSSFPTIRRIKDYAADKTITLNTAGAFTVAVGDVVKVFAFREGSMGGP